MNWILDRFCFFLFKQNQVITIKNYEKFIWRTGQYTVHLGKTALTVSQLLLNIESFGFRNSVSLFCETSKIKNPPTAFVSENTPKTKILTFGDVIFKALCIGKKLNVLRFGTKSVSFKWNISYIFTSIFSWYIDVSQCNLWRISVWRISKIHRNSSTHAIDYCFFKTTFIWNLFIELYIWNINSKHNSL